MIIMEHLQMLKANAKNKIEVENEIKNVLYCLLCQGIMFNPVITVTLCQSLLSLFLFIKVDLKRMQHRMAFLWPFPTHSCM